MFEQKVDQYLESIVTKYDQLSADRKVLLQDIADSINTLNKDVPHANAIFICTHNSRRSQIAELWFRIGIRLHGLKTLHGYSGGTEATAFFPAAVAACKTKGVVMVEKAGSIVNHTYLTTYKFNLPVIAQFSKAYDDSYNPQKDFVAVMVCDSANEACPIVAGAFAKHPLTYKDPKAYDNDPDQAIHYESKVDEIALEMLFLTSLIDK